MPLKSVYNQTQPRKQDGKRAHTKDPALIFARLLSFSSSLLLR